MCREVVALLLDIEGLDVVGIVGRCLGMVGLFGLIEDLKEDVGRGRCLYIRWVWEMGELGLLMITL